MIDFEKVFGLNHFFEKNTENEKQIDIDTLEQSFAVLDNSFDSLLGEFLLIPLNESKESIETTKADVKRAFTSFFDDFRQTAKLIVVFYNKYKMSKDYINLGLATTIGRKFRNAKESYDSVMKKADGLTNKNFEETVKYLNDAYFAYVYLLRGFNSIIDNYNTNHPDTTIARIADISMPDNLSVFKNQNVSDFVKDFLESLSIFTG